MSSSAYAMQDIEVVRIKLWRSPNVILMNKPSASWPGPDPSWPGLQGKIITWTLAVTWTLILRNSQVCLGLSVADMAAALCVLPDKVSWMRVIPNLSISPEKVFFVISKSRRSDSEAAGNGVILESGDDDMSFGRGGRGETTDRAELAGFIRDLNVDEQIDLVALTWLGRGDGDLSDWRELRAQAAQAHNQRTASYLIGTPMLADYLEEAMAQFGKSFEEFEEQL